MRINCPHCGARDSREYTYLGDATVRRPAAGAPMAEWTDYVYLRDNPAGAHQELWYHEAGCHAWLVVTRNTRTHAILAVTAARDTTTGAGGQAV